MNAKELEYILDTRREFHEEIQKAENRIHTNSFYILYRRKDGSYRCHTHLQAPCLARLGYFGRDREDAEDTPIMIFSALNLREENALPKEVVEKYLSYLLKKSPYKDCFITKDVEDVLANGVLCDVNQPGNLIVSGLTAMRGLWEYSYISKSFFDLTEAGVHPDMAFLGAHAFKLEGEKLGFVGDGGHKAFRPDGMTEENIKNFLLGNPVNADKESYEQSPSYGGIHNLFGKLLGYADRKENFFASTVPPTKEEVRVEWGEEIRVSSYESTEYIAGKLQEAYQRIMGAKAEELIKTDVLLTNFQGFLPMETAILSHILNMDDPAINPRKKEIIHNMIGLMLNPNRQHRNYGYRSKNPIQVSIDSLFVWDYTPQGHEYWSQLDRQIGVVNLVREEEAA